ncbi:hypothetical protein [Celeribacter neptunius]|uniref:Polynucleotide kinase PNKP phosphatase domain-containing protein n=1 Tax=Celeribacter neptunius TaxID=588602 RepID=A0A1I3KML3_9RHOB|nr:hypothetical protein [Celeribacter neptunius]SFI73729.1 hypothetical protein SAMN04487991_0740 [Celeribacter neptunius]
MSDRNFFRAPSVDATHAEDVLRLVDVHLGPVDIHLPDTGVLYCDIDGTLADIAHRRTYLERTPKDWKSFKSKLHLDHPVPEVISAVQSLRRAGWQIVLMTGRDAASRKVTRAWLKSHEVPYDAMFMRPDGDYRRDDLVKADLLAQARAEGYEPDLIFDDRDQVVAMWRAQGLFCIQVAEGDF